MGLIEAQAAEVGGRVAYVPMGEVDRAVVEGETDGFVKLISGPGRLGGRLSGGRLLGATVVARRAGEIIHEPALAVRAAMSTSRLAVAPHAYPTWSSAVQQAAAQFFTTVGGRRDRPARRHPG